jgi:ATP-dependent Lon protease
MSENTVLKIIREYTRESGVRNLERQIATICRKTAKKIVTEKAKKVQVTPLNLNQYLGTPRFRYGMAEEADQVGVVTGLAWTEVGGDTLAVEVTMYKGSGKLSLTGQMGDVMKESAQAGYSYIRSRAAELGIDEDHYGKLDIHIHIPEGAIPKDGPSAGISMATALASAFTGRKVYHDVAMTGEITLRGRVLPVGGIKEKVLAAHRAGIKKVIMPKDNKKDLDEIPKKVKDKVQFVLVEHMDQVLEHALTDEYEPADLTANKPANTPIVPHPADYQPSVTNEGVTI